MYLADRVARYCVELRAAAHELMAPDAATAGRTRSPRGRATPGGAVLTMLCLSPIPPAPQLGAVARRPTPKQGAIGGGPRRALKSLRPGRR